MKKLMALCLAVVMSLTLLTACKSADPNNPYGQEPAPMNESAQSQDAEEG